MIVVPDAKPAGLVSGASRLAASVEAGAASAALPLLKWPFIVLIWLAGALVAWQFSRAWMVIHLPQPDVRTVNAQVDFLKLSLYLWLILLSLRLLSISRLQPFAALLRGWASTRTFLIASPLWVVTIAAAYSLALIAPLAGRRLFPGGTAEQSFTVLLTELMSIGLLAVAAYRLYTHIATNEKWRLRATSSPWRVGGYALQISIVKYLFLLIVFPFLQVLTQRGGGRLAMESLTLLQIPLAALMFLLKPAAAFGVKQPWRTALSVGGRNLWVVSVVLVTLNLPADLLRIFLPPPLSIPVSNWPLFVAVYGSIAIVQTFIFVSSETCSAYLLRASGEDDAPSAQRGSVTPSPT